MKILFELDKDEKAALQLNCRKWHLKEFPTDSLGKEINPVLTFEMLLVALFEGEDVYEIMWARDSIIREDLFGKLSEILKMKYDFVYDLWINEGIEGYKI